MTGPLGAVQKNGIPLVPLLLSRDPVEIPLPATAPTGSSYRLVATLCVAEGKKIIATWEFILNPSSDIGRLVLSPPYLDQGFIVLARYGSSPTATSFARYAVPADPVDLQLDLLVQQSASAVGISYLLNWRSQELHTRQVDAWRKQGIPRVQWFYVELTSHCNLKCPFCPSPTLKRPRQLMDPAMAKMIFSQIREYVHHQDTSTGYLQIKRMVFLHVMGEPLLHPDFVECVRYARDIGLVPALFTNCTLLNERHIQQIFDAGISHVTLSLNAADDTGYRSLGAKDSFGDQEQRVLDLLHQRAERDARWLHVDIQYIASAGRTISGVGLLETKEQVWELYRRWMLRVRHMTGGYADQVGNRPHVDSAIMMNPLSMDGTDPSLRLPLDEGIDLVVKSGCSFGNAVLPDGVIIEPSTSGHCPFDNPSRQMAIFADGSVSFCNLDYENSVNLGNLKEQTIDEIWTGERMQDIRASMALGRLSEPMCQRCLGFQR